MDILQKIKSHLFPVNAAGDHSLDPESGIEDHWIAFGVLLWAVAEADESFFAHEQDQIEKILRETAALSDQDLMVVMRSVKEAASERIDMFAFAREIKEQMPRLERVAMVEDLFRVACADGHLDEKEHEAIRTISQSLGMDHSEFITAKIKIKKEKGLDTI